MKAVGRFESGGLASTSRRRCPSDEDPELPGWRKQLSFRGQPYRYAGHQNGIMGHFQVRVVAASEISGFDLSLLGTLQGVAGGLCPYVAVSVGKSNERTAACDAELEAAGSLRGSWARELLVLEISKGAIRAGDAVVMSFQLCNQDGMMQSLVNSAVSTVIGSRGSTLGAGKLEVSSLLSGAVHLVDTWVDLVPRGRLHVHVEYEPEGIEPGPNDVVFLESFARWGQSLVIPPGRPMVVLHRRSPYLLLAFDTFTGREGRIRLHRNCVSVVERLSWFDVALATAARPIDALLRTDPGSWLVRKTRPLIEPLLVMAAPMMASLRVAVSALKVAIRSMLRGWHVVYENSAR